MGSWIIAYCKLAPTLARQMWRHNYVIGHNEYLISTLSESTFTWVYSPQLLFKSTHPSWRYERICEWVFFSEHSVDWVDIARRSSARGRQTTLRWQKQVFIHTQLSHAYLALARLSCYVICSMVQTLQYFSPRLSKTTNWLIINPIILLFCYL